MLALRKKGFTLIELLVVITIIGILATGAVTVFTSQIQKARDTTRISDLKSLQTAVEQAYQDEAAYPTAVNTWSLSFVVSTQAYIELIPEDPKNNQDCNNTLPTTWTASPDWVRCAYAYAVADDSGIANGKYELSTAFEAAGSIKSKADDTVDNWGDLLRFELGIDVASLDTAVIGGVVANTCGGTLSGILLLNKTCN